MADLAVSRRPASLLTLPAELRIRIYSYLVPDIDDIHPQYVRSRRDYLRKDQSSCAPALLRVNRQIYKELMVEMHAHSTFHLYIDVKYTRLRFLNWGCGPTYRDHKEMDASLAAVRHLVIDVDVLFLTTQPPIGAICRVLYKSRSIQSLHLTVYPNFSRSRSRISSVANITPLIREDFLRQWRRFRALPQLSNITMEFYPWKRLSPYPDPVDETVRIDMREYSEELEKYLQATADALKRPPHERVILTKEGQMTYGHKKVKS